MAGPVSRLRGNERNITSNEKAQAHRAGGEITLPSSFKKHNYRRKESLPRMSFDLKE